MYDGRAALHAVVCAVLSPVRGAESWRLYQLPEFPWPEQLRATFSWDGLPPAASVAEYLEAYALKFKLRSAIRLGHEVMSLQDMQGTSAGQLAGCSYASHKMPLLPFVLHLLDHITWQLQP